MIGRLGMLMVLILLAATGWAADGEGTATLAQKQLVAGARVTLTVEFTVGASGIPVGGGIVLGLHHASEWPEMLTPSPIQAGGLQVEGETPGNFELNWHEWIPAKMLADSQGNGNRDGIFHMCLVAKVKLQALKPGEKVKIILGAAGKGITVQKMTDQDHEFRIMTDVNGDGIYKGIAQSPSF